MKHNELFAKYKSSYHSAIYDFTRHSVFTGCAFYAMWHFRKSAWGNLVTIPLLGLLNMKTFVIFHDCGHGSYTPSTSLNNILGIFTGIFVLTPFSWNFNHNSHHLTNGIVENKYNHSFNETVLHTLNEYKSFSFAKRQIYKIVRAPLFFFSIIPLFKFAILMRFNAFRLLKKKRSVQIKASFILYEQMINNIGIALFFYWLHRICILQNYLCCAFIGASTAFMLFHCQHTFNPPYIVATETSWTAKDSGLKGSSFIQIPGFLKYFTGGIEYHHIHHMNSKIPNYHLQNYHEEVVSRSDLFADVPKLSMLDCYRNLWLLLYDEDRKAYITFKDADESIQSRKEK